jgi:hypothetical protein
MMGSDKRQTQDERTLERDPAEDVREEYTTYREVDPDRASPEDAAARREADLQPGPPPEEDPPEAA